MKKFVVEFILMAVGATAMVLLLAQINNEHKTSLQLALNISMGMLMGYLLRFIYLHYLNIKTKRLADEKI